MSPNSLKDKVVVITGASSGIGKALAEEAVARGALVAACARNEARLREALGHLPADKMLLMPADVSREDACRSFIDGIVRQWGGVDILINNAGISMRALFEHADVAVLKQVMDINFWGAVYCTHAALPSIRQRGGVVVGISSIAGYRGLPARTGYSASKAALQAFLEALRTELLGTKATAIWVSPGFTASNIRSVALNASGKSQGETPLDESSLMSAEACAREILKATQDRKRTTVLTGQGKLTVLLNKLFPSLADKLVYKHFLKEADSPLKDY